MRPAHDRFRLRSQAAGVSWPAVVLWILILASAASSGPALLYLTFISGAFGSMQMLPGELVGGANLLPQSVCASFFVAKVLYQRGNAVAALAAVLDARRLGLLALFLAYAVATAFILPRLFAGRTQVITLGFPIDGTSNLEPSSSNLTQAIYMTISVGSAVAMAVIGSKGDVRRHYLNAVLAGGATLAVTGLLDFSAFTLGFSDALEPFRNASYSLLTDAEALGSKRVVGLMPEASAFGGACVGTLASLCFLRPCFDIGPRRRTVPLVIFLLLAMVAISTSSGAYVSLVVFAALFALNWLIRQASPNAVGREGLFEELVVVVTAVAIVLAMVVAIPHVFDSVYDLVDVMVFQKTLSSSYYERSLWTQTAWAALMDTGGVGVGLGAARTSNWVVSITSNTGFVGAFLLFGFMLVAFTPSRSPRSPADREMQRALRLSLIPTLVIAWFGGTIPDIGVPLSMTLGMLLAVKETPEAKTATRPQLSSPDRSPSRWSTIGGTDRRS